MTSLMKKILLLGNVRLMNFVLRTRSFVKRFSFLSNAMSAKGRPYLSIKIGIATVLVLGSIAQGFSQTTTTITATGVDFVVPVGVTKVKVEVWGGGGAGGGVQDNGNNENIAGGGGAGGAYTRASNVTVTPGATITVTVGTGGTGVSNNNGNPGGTTTFASGVPVTAAGGLGGLRGTTAEFTGNGVIATVGGTFNGGAGGEATPTGGTAVEATASGAGGGGAGDNGSGAAGTAGAGGGGTGGAGTITSGGAGADGVTGNGNGTAATQLSGGGSGGFDDDNNRAGGAGFRGQVIVTWIAPFMVGSVTPTGGTVVPGRWYTNSNTGIDIVVPIANDPALLTVGRVQLQGRISSGSFADLLTPFTITAINANMTIGLTKVQFESIAGFATGTTVQIRAIISNPTGENNSTTGTQSASDIFVQGINGVPAYFGTTSTFAAPAGVHAVTVEAWGGGGAGGGATGNTGGGGGGAGGAYASSLVPVTPIAPNYTVTVATAVAGTTGNGPVGGDSWFNTVGTIIAKGGPGGTGTAANGGTGAGATGTLTGTIGTITRSGGNGGTGVITGVQNAGGGGEGGGPVANGNNASVSNGGTGNSQAGDGASSPSVSADGDPGFSPGGGGSGGNALGTTDRAGGGGAAGQVIVTYYLPPTIVSITNSVNPIRIGALTQTVAVRFSEPMNTGINPTITISGANWGLQAAGAWTTGVLTNDTYTTTLTHNATGETNAAAVSTVTLGSPPRSALGTDLAATTNSAVFLIDTQPPTASAPTAVAQTLRATQVSTSTIQSTDAGTIYLVRNTVTVANNFANITTAIAANTAFLAQAAAVAATPYTVTVPAAASALDGTYDIVAVDVAGNVSNQVPGWLTIDNTIPVASAPINTAQFLIAAAVSTSNVQSNEAGVIYMVRNTVTVANNFANITTAIAANTAFIAQGAAAAATPYFVTIPAAASALDGVYDIVAVDAVGNVSNQLPGWLTIDNTVPAAFAVGSVITTGGKPVAGFWNAQNAFVNITVPISNSDPSLLSGTVLIRIENQAAGGFIDLGTAVPILAGDITATFKVVSIAAAVLTVNAKYADTNVLTFGAIINDRAANPTTGTPSLTTLTVETSLPVASAPTSAAQRLKAAAVSTSTIQSSEAGDIYLVRNTVTVGNNFPNITTAIAANTAFLAQAGATAATPYFVTVPAAASALDGLYDIVSVDAAGNVSNQVVGWLTIDNTIPVASAPTNVAQSLKAAAVSTSTIQSNENGSIYLVRNSVTVGNNFANITTAIGANTAFLAQGAAVAATPYFVTVPAAASAIDGVYDIVSVDVAGNVSNQVAGWLTIDNTNPTASAPTNTAQRLKAAAVSTSTIQSNEAGSIYLVRNSVAIGNNFANITAAIGANIAFLGRASAVAATPYFVTIPAAASALDGVYDIVSVDVAGNVSNQVAGWLTIDNTPPSAPNAPTTIAGAVIDGAEYTAGFVVNVSGLIATGALNGDLLELRLGGAAFPTPITHVLTTLEIATDAFDFTVVCPQMGADALGKLISARITDVATNVGASSADLSLDVNTTPTTAATAMTFSAITTTSMTVNFVNGDGVFRILVARQGAPVSFVPLNNNAYPPNSNFATSPDLGSGNKVVASTSGTNITNLPSGDDIYYAVFEFNNCATRQNYFTTALTGDQATNTGLLTTVGTGGGVVSISSLIDTQAEANAASANFSFVVDDDGATNAVDNSPTRITSIVINRDGSNDQTGDWTTVIGGVILTDGVTTINSVANPANFPGGYLTANSITISAIPSILGVVADNTTRTFQVKIWLQSSISAIDIDNKKFVFSVAGTDFGLVTANSSQFVPLSTANSGISNNTTLVVADRLTFTTIPAGGSAGAGFPLVAASIDVNNNVDLDINQQITITAPLFPVGGAITFANATPATAAQNLINGRRGWTNVQVTVGGNYQFRVSDTDAALPALTLLTSGIINFGAGSAFSTVSESPFVYPTSIDYKLFQRATGYTLGVPPPVDAIRVAEFVVQDGGLTLIDPDGIGTTLTNITFGVTNPGNIRFVGISDGTNMVATQSGGASVAFSGMSLLAEDIANLGTGQKVFGVYVSFFPNVTDNQHFEFQVTNVTAGGGSTFAFTDGAAGTGGARSSTVATNNVVVVTATELRFIQEPPASILLGVAMAPAVTLEATDILGSRDRDNTNTYGLSSTGTLSSAPTVTLALGTGTYSAITHSAIGTARTLTTTGGLIADTSTPFNITASNASNIIANTPPLGYPVDIAYQTMQAPDILNTLTSVVAARFDIQDGGGVADADIAGTTLTSVSLDLGTNYTFIRRIALYDAAGTGEILGTEQAVGAQIMNFPGLSITALDNSTASFTVRVSFNTVVVDNQQFSFTVTAATTQPNVSSTFPSPAGAVSSTADPINKIEVTATKLIFTTNPNSPLLASIDISTVPQLPIPVIRAFDVFDNTDRDYATNVTLASLVTLSTNTLTSDALAPNAGVYTFPTNFQFTQTGVGTLTASSGGLAIANSTAVTVNSGLATTINGASAPGTISSLFTTLGTAVSVFSFNINDDPGGTALNNNDGLPTLLSDVIITAGITNNTIADWTQVIGGAELTDGTFVYPATSITNTPNNRIIFNGIPTGVGTLGRVLDNTTKNYSLRIFLNPAMATAIAADIDGRQFEFVVQEGNITLAPHSTRIIVGQTATSGNNDVVSVAATQLRFLTPAGPMSASLNTDFPGSPAFVSVEATDINNNRDKNFVQPVRFLDNTTSRTMINTPTVNVTPFALGILDFATNFQYTSGVNNDNVTLTVRAGAGPGTTCGVNGIICGTSPTITLLSSFESRVKPDPLFVYQPNIGYINYRAANIQSVDIDNVNGSYELSRILLSDGDADFIAGDTDGAATVLTSITIRVADGANASTLGHIKKIALYNSGASGATEIQELPVLAGDVTAGEITFSGLTITASDNGTTPISIRVSFNESAATIIDKTLLRVSIANAAVGGGSQFRTGAGEIAGVPIPGLQAPLLLANFVDVVATKLDFTTQPVGTTYAPLSEAVPLRIVTARDQFSIRDLDFNFPANVFVSALPPTATVNGSYSFTAGILNLGSLTYGSTGKGTLTVTSPGYGGPIPSPITSAMTGSVGGLTNTSTQCNLIEVVHLTTIGQPDANGITPVGTALLAGSANNVLLGFQFSAPYRPAGQPLLNAFTISFNQSIADVLSDVDVVEAISGGAYNALLPDVETLPNVTVTLITSPPGLQVSFGATPRDLTVNPNLTYYLRADVDFDATGATSDFRASIIDGGISSATVGNINASQGSQFSNIQGHLYSFASIAAPTLISSYPALAQTNVSTAQTTIELKFSVPVFTRDNKIRLTEKANPLNFRDLVPYLNSGVFGVDPTPDFPPAQPIIFTIPPLFLQPDMEYYVTIANGTANGGPGGTATGIMDLSLNFFPGISDIGALYFRTANPDAPALLAVATGAPTDPSIANGTANSATVNGVFDRQGKAYFMVLEAGSTAPTALQIFSNPTTYPPANIVAKDTFDIFSTNPISQFGVMAPLTPGPKDVWVVAESYSETKAPGANPVRTPIRTLLPYGPGPSHVEEGVNPTLTFTPPAAGTNADPTTNLISSVPPTNLLICSNSFQILNNPIIFYEGVSPSASGRFDQAGTQTMNLVLPSGFQFDDSTLPNGDPVYGEIELIGDDFTGPGTLRFLSNTILKMTFENTTATSTNDQIVISGLRVRATGSQSGNIFRLGGNAIQSIGDGAPIGGISASESAPISFNNSYSTSLGNSPPIVETAIPDNAPSTMVTLTPIIGNPFDFGPSQFSGQGVNSNLLNITAVTKDFPFNITINHTDQNGCRSVGSVQYVVYDHVRAINITNPAKPPNPLISPQTLDQGPNCSSNPAFVIDQTNPSPAAPGVVRHVTYDNLPGYYLTDLIAQIPAGSTSIIDSTSFGGAWVARVGALPIVTGLTTVNTVDYPSYSFDDKLLVNARALSGNAIPYTYDFFKDTTDLPASPLYSRQSFYKGGSLGKVEFVGTFRNASNTSVVITRRQIVEFFLPAVPAVEIITPYSYLETNDLSNGVGTGGPNNIRPGNPGTPIFCKAGGTIVVNGWPKAVSGASVGTFTLQTIAGASITPPPFGFVDNGNGSAVLDPAILDNGFADIKIVYTYKDNNSPCSSTAYQIIRITPNPIANFELTSVPGHNILNPATSYCEDNQINFNAVGGANPSMITPAPVTTPVTNPNTIIAYHWNFGDINSTGINRNDTTNIDPGPPVVIGLPLVTVPHTFSLAQNYLVSLEATSFWGCGSIPYAPILGTTVGPRERTIPIGGIPNVKARLTGVSVDDTFNFFDNGSNIVTSIPILPTPDVIQSYEWDFNNTDSLVFNLSDTGPTPTTNYLTPGKYEYDLRVTSTLGCVNKLGLQPNPTLPGVLPLEPYTNYRSIVVLGRVDLNNTVAFVEPNVYDEPFNGSNANWQTWGTGRSTEEIHFASHASRISWQWGPPPPFPPVAPYVMKFNDPASIIANGTGLWKTNLTVNKVPTDLSLPTGHWYTDKEKSALYSPSFAMDSLKRPMISFHSASQLENSDGVALQFSTDDLNVADPAKVWETLGIVLGDGEDWHTSQGLAGKPGDQVGNDFGWSGFTSPSTPNVPQGQISPKHVLDQIGAPANKVVFRFALGSAKTDVAKEGFSVDNFRIGNRTRTILLESFVNAGNSDIEEHAQADSVADLQASGVGTEVVKINYHLKLPNLTDPFIEDNAADASSRALFYNITTTPRSRLDGERDQADRLYAENVPKTVSGWGFPLYNLRTLQLAQAQIDVTTTTNTDGTLSISALVTSKVSSGVPSNTTLHVAILEQEIMTANLPPAKQSMVDSGEPKFEYVLKKMLPSAAGSRFGDILPEDATRTFGPFVWTPTKLYPDPGDLAVAVFLQSEAYPFEVYQVGWVKTGIADPPTVTGLEPIDPSQVLVFPNPANNEMTIRLPGQLSQAASVQLVDQTGRVTLQSSIPEGASTKTLNVSDMSGGVYILQIQMGQGVLARKKVMIIHQD